MMLQEEKLTRILQVKSIIYIAIDNSFVVMSDKTSSNSVTKLSFRHVRKCVVL
jgi:hypothetical protein